MTTTTDIISCIRGENLREVATELGPQIAQHEAGHDRNGTFVAEAYELLRRAGFLATAVPSDLGGGGATTAQVAWAQYELARNAGSAALATSMHQHVVLANAWRWRHGAADAEALLRRVAAGTVLASTGGGDFTVPTGTASRVDGGWEVTGRKSFVSGAPAADLASMWAVTESGDAIAFGVSLHDPLVDIVENWDAPGMRGTASHDIVLNGVFIADERVTATREPGVFAPVLAVVTSKAFPVISATYLGIAVGARDDVVARTRGSSRATDPGVHRTIGAIDQHLQEGRWILDGVLAGLGEDPEPTSETLVTASLAKRAVIDHARATGDLAMDVLGGRAYRRGDPVERAWRDLRAGPFHPIENELTLRVAGAVALDQPFTLR